MKAMILVASPEECCNLLNGDLSLLVRKKFLKDYVGWVYIYCTKNGDYLMKAASNNGYITCMRSIQPKQMKYSKSVLNGKVVARFWCDNVEDFEFCEFSKYKDNLELYNECVRKDNELCKKACISCVQMVQYLDTKAIGKDMFGKAIHIAKLEPFDKPKEISEFNYLVEYRDCKKCPYNSKPKKCEKIPYCCEFKKLKRAPQSWCYVEVGD